jgi:hypothetical protein
VLRGEKTVAELQAVFDAASVAGSTVTLSGVIITGTGTLDLGTATVKIAGRLKLPTAANTGIEINAAKATVTFGNNATIDGDKQSIIATGTAQQQKTEIGEATDNTSIWLVDRLGPPTLEDSFSDLTITGVAEYTLDDTSYVPNNLTVWVYKTLTVKGYPGSNGLLGNIVAKGNVELAASTLDTVLSDPDKVNVSGVDVSGANVPGGVVIGIAASLSSKIVAVELPDTITGYKFDLAAGSELTVKNTTNFGAEVLGSGTLKLADATTVNITGGTANIEFISAPGVLTGPVFAGQSGIKANSVKFPNGFTAPTGAGVTVDLSGNVIIPETKGITFADGSGKVKLAAGSVVATATPVSATNTVLSVPASVVPGAELVLGSGAANDTLTIGIGRTVTASGAATFEGAVSFAGAAVFASTADFTDQTLPGGGATFGGATFASTADFTGAADFSGATTFSGVATFTSTADFSGAATFTNNVVFGGDVTLTAAPATFNKTAFFAASTDLIMTTAESTVTLDKTNGALAVGAPVANVYSQVLAPRNGSSAHVVLTPVAGTQLTFGGSDNAKTVAQDQSDSGAHGIKITGTPTLISGTTYTVASVSGKVGTLELGDSAVLTLGDTLGVGAPAHVPPKVVLTGVANTAGAILKGAGSLVAGGTTIVGGANGWQAVNASSTATIAANSITGGAALTAGSPESEITVAVNKMLTVNNATITLAASKGKVTLAGHAQTPGKLLLKGGGSAAGKLIVDAGLTESVTVGTTSLINFIVTDGGGTPVNVLVTKDGLNPATGTAVKGADSTATAGVLLGSIAGGTTIETHDALLTGPAGGTAVIVKGWKVQVPAS